MDTSVVTNQCEFADHEHDFCRRWEVRGLKSCARCLVDPFFRDQMEAILAWHHLQDAVEQGETSIVCSRYGIDSTVEFCTVCQRNGVLRQRLWLTREKAPRGITICQARKEQVGEVDLPCCGGKVKSFPTYRCTEGEKPVTVQDCARCLKYVPRGRGETTCDMVQVQYNEEGA